LGHVPSSPVPETMVGFGSIVLKKSEYLLDPIFSAPQVDADVGGLVIHARLNEDRSESICGGNQRQSKMSSVFRQICNDSRFATFSTESAKTGHSCQLCSSRIAQQSLQSHAARDGCQAIEWLRGSPRAPYL
jgi:hypothetical protein